MIEWATEWYKKSKEERLEAAKKDAVRYHEKGWMKYVNLPMLSTFKCNICEETKKGPPYGEFGDEYTSRYYCQECLQKAHVVW